MFSGPSASGTFPAHSLLGRLDHHAREQPDAPAYTFLRDRGEPDTLTFGQLADRVRTLAARLREHAKPGDRAVLLYPHGLEFVCAFLGCLAAGVIAVPAYPPRRNRKAERLHGILADCTPAVLLTAAEVRDTLTAESLGAEPPLVLVTDGIPTAADAAGECYPAGPADAAFLQYTSGSTGSPKGVVVTHGSISYNEWQIQTSFGHERAGATSPRGVTWLPLFHDMGLIGNALQPLHVGFHSVLMSPTGFLQDPYRWLKAISDHRGTTAGGPNFAFDLCVRTVTEEQKKTLDLSCLRVMYNGSEPVRADTLDRFAAAFARCGLRPSMFLPCYGLAEATLFVSGGPSGAEPRRLRVQPAALEAGRTETADGEGGRWLVSSGRPGDGTRVVAVDPATRAALPDGRVGELWVQSPSVAAGYWNRPDETRTTFENHLATGEGPFLNTGDLGFLDGGEVFVTGRAKDVIVVRGRNIYPQDIEAVVERVLPFAGANACAAFGVEDGGGERLAVVVEADRALVRAARDAAEGNGTAEAGRGELAAAVGKVRQAVGEEFEVPVAAVAFVRPGAFPRTSSGKVRRRACRDGMRDESLDLVHAWQEVVPERGTERRVEEPDAEPGKLSPPAGQSAPAVAGPGRREPADVSEDDARRRQQRRYAVTILLLPLVGMAALVGVVWDTWVTPLDLALLAGMYAVTMLGISVGFHRLFTHNAFKAGPLVRNTLAVAGSMTGEGSLIFWVAAHRRHHQFSDREGDPHSPHLHGTGLRARLRGLWYAHLGWMYHHDVTDASVYAKDLLRDPVLRWISRNYLALTLIGLAIPAVIAGLVTESWVGAARGLFWGGFVRMLLAHHFTWSVNSICHAFGRHDHDTGDQSRNNLWLALPTMGEAWHNNHHDAPNAASFCHRWWQVDLGAGVIRCLELLGLAWDVRRPKGKPRAEEPRTATAEVDGVEPAGTELREVIHAAIVGWLRAEVNPRIESLDPDLPLTAAGIDSVGAAVVALEIEKATGVRLSPDLVYQHPTINKLAVYLANRVATGPATDTSDGQPRPACPAGPTAADALGGSMADFASPAGRDLRDRVAAYDAWRASRRGAALWPFYRLARSPAAPSTSVAGEDGAARAYLNFGSQDYLGLARDPRVLRAAQQAVAEFGVHSAGSPVLLGTTSPMTELERTLAAATGKEDCVVFPTGWAAGFGVVTGLIRGHDTLVLDALCHRCLMEGAYHVTREPLLFRHNDLGHLRQTLARARERDARNGLFVVTESLFSMDSDSPDLPALVRLVREFDGILILDVAHDFGATGRQGLGLLEQLDGTGLAVDVVMGSFSKTFAATGGFVAADRAVADYLRGHTTSYVFSNAISPVQAAAALECCRVAFSEEGGRLRGRLLENVLALRAAMEAGGFRVGGTPSPIVPVFVGAERVARLTSRQITRNGLLANLVEYPAVPRGSARFRFQVMSTHTPDMAREAAALFARSHREASESATPTEMAHA